MRFASLWMSRLLGIQESTTCSTNRWRPADSALASPSVSRLQEQAQQPCGLRHGHQAESWQQLLGTGQPNPTQATDHCSQRLSHVWQIEAERALRGSTSLDVQHIIGGQHRAAEVEVPGTTGQGHQAVQFSRKGGGPHKCCTMSLESGDKLQAQATLLASMGVTPC